MHPEAKAALVFTPSYYGTSVDVGGLAEACHARDLPLVTDDAWGLDYALSGHPDLPGGALEQGADLAIGSVHKTLSALCQTSVLSVGSDRIDTERLGLCFELEESTSASALLLSSIDGARRQFVREGRELLDRAVTSARLLRDRLRAEVPELEVVDPEQLVGLPGVVAADPTHVLIETKSVGLTGFQADDWLRDERQIDVELADHRRIMPLVTFAHGEAEIDRLVRALRDLVDERGEPGSGPDVAPLPSRRELRTEQAMLPRDAFFAKTELVDPSDAVGRVSAELVTPYPPGIPAVAPGEIYNDTIVEYLDPRDRRVRRGRGGPGARQVARRLRVSSAPRRGDYTPRHCTGVLSPSASLHPSPERDAQGGLHDAGRGISGRTAGTFSPAGRV